MTMKRAWAVWATAGLIAVAAAGCSSSAQDQGSASPSGQACPVVPVSVVVTTNVWGSVVDQLAGACANVNVIISSPTADPHDFEPTAATSSAFSSAALVVQNGLGYDAWATKIEASLGASAPPVLDLGAALGLAVGANPHIWYSPSYVQQSAGSITADLKKALPSASEYFDAQAAAFTSALEPYLAEVAANKSKYTGTKIGATESLFVYMAEATGLQITTPESFMTAEANGTEPSAADVALFRTQLLSGTDKALIFNTQTDGGLPQQMLDVAKQANVPVVDVTETLSPETATFQSWQLAQLQNLYAALGG